MPSLLGDEIKRLRQAAGLTQEALADALQVSQGFVTNLETGRKSIATTKTLYALCDALGVKCDHFRPFLVGQSEEVKPKPGAGAKPKPKPKPKPKKK